MHPMPTWPSRRRWPTPTRRPTSSRPRRSRRTRPTSWTRTGPSASTTSTEKERATPPAWPFASGDERRVVLGQVAAVAERHVERRVLGVVAPVMVAVADPDATQQLLLD